MTSKTNEVFGTPQPGYYRIYYNIKTPRDLQTALEKQYPVVLMFWANWSAPSRAMLKHFRTMALAKKDHAVFCRLDIDEFKDDAQKYAVEALPTFVLIQNGKEQRKVVGMNVDELNRTIKDSI